MAEVKEPKRKVTRVRRALYVCGNCGLIYSAIKGAFNGTCPDCKEGPIYHLNYGDGKIAQMFKP